MESNREVSTTGKFTSKDIRKLISIYQNLTNLGDDIEAGKCDEFKLSNIECPVNCLPNCTNNEVSNCKWLSTYISDVVSIHSFGLFSTK